MENPQIDLSSILLGYTMLQMVMMMAMIVQGAKKKEEEKETCYILVRNETFSC